jgi:hypothetical protein
MRPTWKIPAKLLNLAKSYSLAKYTCTVVKSQFLGLQLSRQIASLFRDMNMSDCNKSWSDH